MLSIMEPSVCRAMTRTDEDDGDEDDDDDDVDNFK